MTLKQIERKDKEQKRTQKRTIQLKFVTKKLKWNSQRTHGKSAKLRNRHKQLERYGSVLLENGIQMQVIFDTSFFSGRNIYCALFRNFGEKIFFMEICRILFAIWTVLAHWTPINMNNIRWILTNLLSKYHKALKYTAQLSSNIDFDENTILFRIRIRILFLTRKESPFLI